MCPRSSSFLETTYLCNQNQLQPTLFQNVSISFLSFYFYWIVSIIFSKSISVVRDQIYIKRIAVKKYIISKTSYLNATIVDSRKLDSMKHFLLKDHKKLHLIFDKKSVVTLFQPRILMQRSILMRAGNISRLRNYIRILSRCLICCT